MNTNTFAYIIRNITGVSYEYANSLWFTLSDKDKCQPVMAGFYHGRDIIRRRRTAW